jgi:hypothetical protein
MTTRIPLVVLAMCIGASVALIERIAAPVVLVAHGGGLDSRGCHNDRQRGGYHCHQGPLAGQSFGSASEAAAALARRNTPPPPTAAPTARATASPPTATISTASVIDFYESPNGAYQRFTADDIARDKLTFEVLPAAASRSSGKEWVQVRMRTASGSQRIGYVEANSSALRSAQAVPAVSTAVQAAPVSTLPTSTPALCGLDRKMFELLVSLRMQTYESTGDSWAARATLWRNEIAGNLAAGRTTASLDTSFGRYQKYCAEGVPVMAGMVVGEWVGIGLRAP